MAREQAVERLTGEANVVVGGVRVHGQLAALHTDTKVSGRPAHLVALPVKSLVTDQRQHRPRKVSILEILQHPVGTVFVVFGAPTV